MEDGSDAERNIEAFLKNVNGVFGNDIWTINDMKYVAKNISKFKITEVFTVAVLDPIERHFRRNNVQEYFYRVTKDSELFNNNKLVNYRVIYKMSEADGLLSKLSDKRTIYFQGALSKDNTGNVFRKELLYIIDDSNREDEKKLDNKDRSIVEILNSASDSIVADSFYTDQEGVGATSGASKQLYKVLGASGKFERVKYLEIEFRPDGTRKVRMI